MKTNTSSHSWAKGETKKKIVFQDLDQNGFEMMDISVQSELQWFYLERIREIRVFIIAVWFHNFTHQKWGNVKSNGDVKDYGFSKNIMFSSRFARF